jgi:hypothetical protein
VEVQRCGGMVSAESGICRVSHTRVVWKNMCVEEKVVWKGFVQRGG